MTTSTDRMKENNVKSQRNRLITEIKREHASFHHSQINNLHFAEKRTKSQLIQQNEGTMYGSKEDLETSGQ